MGHEPDTRGRFPEIILFRHPAGTEEEPDQAGKGTLSFLPGMASPLPPYKIEYKDNKKHIYPI